MIFTKTKGLLIHHLILYRRTIYGYKSSQNQLRNNRVEKIEANADICVIKYKRKTEKDMRHNFQMKAIDQNSVHHFFALSDEQLQEIDAVRMTVDQNLSYPCRVSLQDAEVGEEVILFSFDHLDKASPFKAKSPVFARKGAPTSYPEINEIPLMLRHRLLSVRAFDKKAMIQDSKTVKGTALEDAMQELLSNEKVAYLQIHNAGHGCYNCHVDRA